MIRQVIKRDGSIVDFNPEKIAGAIFKAGESTHEFGKSTAEFLARIVITEIEWENEGEPVNIEVIQNKIETVLMRKGFFETAKAFILYREKRRELRELRTHITPKLIEEYIGELTWEVHENANIDYSIQGLKAFISGKAEEIYWLERAYPKKIAELHRDGYVHIHNLGFLGSYCVGWDLEDLLKRGFGGVQGKPYSKPAKHLSSALGQMMNFLFTLQNEAAGAVAFSSFDTYLAPFVYFDKLSYKEVKQQIQEFIYNMNQTMRTGGQSPFSNITVDIEPHTLLKDMPVIVGAKEIKEITYGMLQKEMNMINQALFETYIEGDGNGRPFTFPIPTVNIDRSFDWNNPDIDPLWEATAKYGVPYFANYVNSDLKPEDARSMCCRLKLDTRELKNKGGGLFGANPLTGCYDEDTEVLTTNGWKKFNAITFNDELFTRKEDGKVEIHKPVRKFEYDWDGNLIRFKHKSLDLLVTPNHKMVVERYGKYKLVEAQEFDVNNDRIPKYSCWDGAEEEFFILPPVQIMKGIGPHSKFSNDEINKIRYLNANGENAYKLAEEYNCNPVTIYNIVNKENYGAEKRSKVFRETEPLKIKMDDWLAFFGIWIAEGSIDNEQNAMDHGYRVVITQLKQDVRKEIKDLLDIFQFNYTIDDKGFVINSKQLWSYLKQFGHAHDRFIPDEIKKLSKRQLKILFDWMLKGDGHIRKTTKQINYWTASKRLADDLQEIIMKLGWVATISPRKRDIPSIIDGREIHSSVTYTIGIQQSKHYRLRGNNINLEYYKGKVYSVEVPNHTLFVRRKGKSTWCGNSIGVITINIPRIGYVSKSEDEFFKTLSEIMEASKDALEAKRKTVEQFTEMGLYPYSRIYLEPIINSTGHYWDNHFSTIGIVGMNEALLNYIGKDITTPEGVEFTIKTLNFMRAKLSEFQEETGHMYNLEATPAESTSYSLALKDKKKYPDIITSGTSQNPYYTNSTQLPVGFTDDPIEAAQLQDEIQSLYTGGTVLHFFLGERLNNGNEAKVFVRKIIERFKLPYITITPTFSVCPKHGYIAGEHEFCPRCDEELVESEGRSGDVKKEGAKVNLNIDI